MDSKIEFAVEMKNPDCANKVEKALKDISGIKSMDINLARQSVIVEGNVVADSVKKVIEKETGIYVAVMGQGSIGKGNFGSAVAAICVGPSPVRGLIRMTQVSPETCVIEGSMDGLTNIQNVCVSVHEYGDLSKGCESCGPPYCSNDDTNIKVNGVFKSLIPNNDGTTEFRLSSQELKVPNLIGRCIVVHNGNEEEVRENKSKRLACGIIARSSGLFQNSKRFCACSGVTLWEEKKRLAEEDRNLGF